MLRESTAQPLLPPSKLKYLWPFDSGFGFQESIICMAGRVEMTYIGRDNSKCGDQGLGSVSPVFLLDILSEHCLRYLAAFSRK